MKKRALSIITTFLIIFTLIAPIPLSHTALTAAHYPGGIPTGIDQFKLLSNGPGAGDSGSVHEEGEPSVFHVVLVTGDVVTVTQYPSGRRSFAVQGAEPKEGFAIFTIRNETYIVPEDANLKRLDLGLFDIDYLVREEYYKLDFTPLLVSLSSQDAVSTLTNDPGIKGFVSRAFRSVPAVAAKAKFADVKSLYTALMEKPDVAKVWLDAKVHVALYESLPIIGLTNPANLVWSAGITGEYMKIAIIDTGIDPSHPDVGPRIFAAQDFTDDGTIDDLYGHGTHVAAIAAGNAAASTSPVDPNGKFKGVAYQASLINAKVVGSNGYGYSSWAIAGIEWAVSQGADVINLSLQYGTTDGNDPVAQAVNAAVDSGVVACVAAGNFGWRYFTVTTPGSASKALTVGATDKWDQLAWFSSRGPVTGGEIRLKPDVVAPGVNVYSAHATNAPSGEAMPNPPGQPQSGPPNYPPYYTWGWSGTSMATPHVTGLSALVLQSHPGWQPWQVKDAIMNTAVPLDGYNVYEEGTGRVVAPAAVFTNVLLDESTYTFGMITDSLATPSHQYRVINYGAAAITVDLSVTLNDAGTGADWTWTHASTSVPTLWNIPGGGTSAIFNLNLDMAGLPPGMYSGMLVATVQGTGQQLRSACGFARMDTLTVTKLDMEGNPAPGWLVWKWKLNPSSELDYWLNEWQTWTDNNGQAVFYHTDGNYELVTATWSDPPIFTIADNLAVSGNMATTLDERTTNKVDFDPNKSGQIIAATNTQLYYPYTITLPGVTMSGWWGFGIMWSYPGSTESWISMVSSNWKATFGYSYYPSSDFDLTDWGTVNTSEWHDLLYASNGVPGPMHFVADYSSLVQKWSVYPVNLGPPVGASRWTFTYARLFDDPSTGFVPWWYGASAFGWKISLPQARMEYLSPDVWYDQDLEKVWDIPWQWTSGWFWHGPYRALSAGDQWTEIWNTGFSNKLYAWVDTSTNDFEVWGHAIMDGYFHNYHDYGRWPAGTLEVTGPGGLLFSGSIDDAFDVWFGVQPLGPYTTTIDATATQQLSTRMTAVYTFDTSVADSILPDGTVEVPQIAFGPWGLNLENTGRGGEVTVGIFANSFTGTKMNSVEAWYSTDDGGAWNPLALSETPWTNYYEGQLPDLSGKYVSLKATAMNALGNSVTQTCIRAFYVKAAEPVPFTSYLVRNPVTLDGRMTTPDEWSDTIPRDLTFGAGSSLKKVPAELWIKNDGTWLYVMERVRSPGGAPGRDNWDSGSIGYYWDSWGPPSHRWQHSDLGGVNFDGSTFDLYGWDEVQWYDDTSATPGQNNVQGAATYDGTYYWFEFRKPLKSGDGYDWTFEPGATYGPMPPDLQVGFWDDSEATFYGTHILLHLSGPGGAGLAGVSQGYVLGFKVADVYSSSYLGEDYIPTTSWSPTRANFQVTLGAGESLFLIGSAQVWNDYANIGSSIAICRGGVRVSGDMFAAGATLTSRELATAIAVDTPSAGTYTYSLCGKTDPGGRAALSQGYVLGFKVSDVYSDSYLGENYISTTGWSPTDASFPVTLGAGESLFLIGSAQVWNDYAAIGSSIAVCSDGVRVSGDMFAAGATLTSRELATAIAVDSTVGPHTYSLCGKTDPGGRAALSQGYVLGFKVSNVYSDSYLGENYISTTGWSPTDASFQVTLNAGESLFLIGSAQLWNGRANVGSSIAICRDGVRVSGDMYAAGAAMTRRELASAIAVDTPGTGTYTYSLSMKTD